MIEELVSRVFATRNAVHLAHWAETSGYRHKVLGKFYESLITNVDTLVEAHIGAFGRLENVPTKTVDIKNIAAHLAEEAMWLDKNRDEVAGKVRAISNLVDDMVNDYLSTHFKLTKLS